MVERHRQHIDDNLHDKQLADLLDRHAEGLLTGDDPTDAMIAAHGEEFPALDGLLQVARTLRAKLVPVKPREDYVVDLREQLREMQQKDAEQVAFWVQLRQRVSGRSKVIGALVSIMAMAVIAFRIVASVLMLFKLLANRRQGVSPA